MWDIHYLIGLLILAFLIVLAIKPNQKHKDISPTFKSLGDKNQKHKIDFFK